MPGPTDAMIRTAITRALHATNWLPVPPLIDIIVRYATPFRSVVTTLGKREPVRALTATAAAAEAESPPFICPAAIIAVPPDPRVPTGAGMGAPYFVIDSYAHCVFMIFEAGGVVPVAGDGMTHQCGYRNGPALGWAQFWTPTGICVDPIRAHRFYVCDFHSVRVLDLNAAGASSAGGSSGVGRSSCGDVYVLAGGGGASQTGFTNGYGAAVRFHGLSDVVCTSDGATLIVADTHNRRLRSIDTQTGQVSTLGVAVGDDETDALGLFTQTPIRMAWDCTAARDAVLYVSTKKHQIVRVERRVARQTLRSIELGKSYAPVGVAVLPNGWVLFSCDATHSLYTIDPAEAAAGSTPELIAGAGACTDTDPERAAAHDDTAGGYCDGYGIDEARLHAPRGLCLIDSSSGDAGDRSVLVVDSENGCVRRVTLPPSWFVPPPTPVPTAVAAAAAAVRATAAATAAVVSA